MAVIKKTLSLHQLYVIFHVIEICIILRFDSKDNTFKFGQFMTICGHFFANYINVFHKT